MVLKLASTLVKAAEGRPILDVACGSGRHALLLLGFGCIVICMDRDLAYLKARKATLNHKISRQLVLQQLDLVKDSWPLGPSVVGGIINVHFFEPTLFPFFGYSISPGGYLLFESISGRGGNYLELPKAGEVKTALENEFDLETYEERNVESAFLPAL